MAKRRMATTESPDLLQQYYAQIRDTPLLTPEQEKDLSRRIQAGDAEARRILVESNLRLVVKIARAYSTPDVSLLDLIQDGNLGLLKAAARFDHAKDVRFSTYAAWWIRQAITRSLANRRRTIRLPHRKEDALRRIQRAYNFLSQKLMRAPDTTEIAAEANLEESEVVEIMLISATPASLDAEMREDAGTMLDMVEDYTYSPDGPVIEKMVRERTMRTVNRLPQRERDVICSRFALDGGERQTLKTISRTMGVSPETVRQIEMRAIKKLRSDADDLRELMVQ